MGYVRFCALIRAIAEYLTRLARNALRSTEAALNGECSDRELGANLVPQLHEETSGTDDKVRAWPLSHNSIT